MILVITDACFVQTNTMAAVIHYTFDIPTSVIGGFIVIVGALVILKGLSVLVNSVRLHFHRSPLPISLVPLV